MESQTQTVQTVKLKALTLRTFKKRFKISQRELNDLAIRGIIVIKQSGYAGHSLCHPRIIIFDKILVERALTPIEENLDPYICLGSLHRNGYCGLRFRTKKELLNHQKEKWHTQSDKVLIKAWKTKA